MTGSGIATCPGCGSRLPAIEGPVHAYMTASPACWAAFGLVLAREYETPALIPIHRLTVDAWAVQHPGDGSRRAIQSVGLHLARLMEAIEGEPDGKAASDAMLGFADRKDTLPVLPPRTAYRVTVADVVDATAADAHRDAVLRWARATWDDWRDQHGVIRAWARGRGGAR